MERKVIEIVAGVARHPAYRMNEPVNFLLNAGEQLAIVGPNGSGKTMLVNTIIGRYPLLINEVHYNFGADNGRMAYENIRYIAFVTAMVIVMQTIIISSVGIRRTLSCHLP